MQKLRDSKDRLINFAFLIPAYDSNHEGLVICLILSAKTSSQFSITSSGSIAKSLEKNLVRVIKIMSSLKKAWDCLETYDYTLTSFNENYNVQDSRNADFSLSIAALNIVRNHYQQNSSDRYMGTGSLRVDGSFSETHLEEVKAQAVLPTEVTQKSFVTAKQCNHLFDLEALLNGC